MKKKSILTITGAVLLLILPHILAFAADDFAQTQASAELQPSLEAPDNPIAQRNFITKDGATLPKGKGSLALSLGAPFPPFYGIEFVYGLTDWLDIGVNGSSVGVLTLVGGQTKVRFLQSRSNRLNLGLQVVADYIRGDSGGNDIDQGLYLWPSMIGGIRFGEEKRHSFFCDVGAVLLTSGSNSEWIVRPGAGFEFFAGGRTNLFVRGYGLVNVTDHETFGGGEAGVVVKFF